MNNKNNPSESRRAPARKRAESAPKLTKPQVRIERIYQALRRQICLLDLPPGVVLREQDLADRFHISRTPIRHALSRLATDGLVESRQGVGTTVTTLDYADLFDIYYVRATLAEAIGDSGPVDPPPGIVESLESLEGRCAELGSTMDVRAFGEINIELHTGILSIVRNRPLREISERLFFQTARIWFQILPQITWQRALEELADEINQVRRAMQRGDLKAVGLIHRNHIFTVLVLLRQLVGEQAGAGRGHLPT